MPRMRRSSLKTGQPDKDWAQSSDHAKPSISPAASLQEAPVGGFANPQAMSSNQMLHMQRVMGNRAVARLLNRRGPADVSRNPAGTTTLQRLPSYEDFLKGTRKMAKVGPEIFSYTPGEEALSDSREQNIPQAGRPADFDAEIRPGLFKYVVHEDIESAYRAVDLRRSLRTLSNLFDTITYWETLNHYNADKQWYSNVMFYISGIKDQIRSEVQAMTTEMYGTKADLDTLERTSRLREGEDQKWAALMPEFLKEVGVAPRYFNKQLMAFPERIEALKEFSDALRDGQLTDATTAYQAVANVPGMYLIKPLFIHKYAANSGLGSLVRTQPEAQQGPLTDEEKLAIIRYSGGEFKAMNADLRSAITSQPREDVRNISELAVRGMNKLPAYQGLAFRGLLTEPGGYFDVIQPGARIVDLAFQSASPSLKGVEAYMATDAGSKHVYFMIHTKAAVNIMAFAKTAPEAEVLFKPGANFRVKAVWHHVGGKVPPNAPAEAQMILHTRGDFKSGELNRGQGPILDKYSSGVGTAEIEDRAGNAGMMSDDDQKAVQEWHPVKVIEMVEQ